MPFPRLLPLAAGFDPWTTLQVAPGRLERAFSGDRMRKAWASAETTAERDLTDWLAANMATPGKIVGWSTARTDDGFELRGTVEFNDGKTWWITYGWTGAGNWRARRVVGAQ